MSRRPRQVRRSQFDILAKETRLEEDRKLSFYGSARVDLDALAFERSPECQISQPNIQRLFSAFEKAGCLRLHPQYHVPAVITKEQLDGALTSAESPADALLSKDPEQWPLLTFPDDYRVQCLHGRHRIEAAKRFLSISDRWWVVDFYTSGQSHE